MSVRQLWDAGSARVMATAGATALAAGLVMGGWLQPRAPEPAVSEPQPILADDPGLTRWREVIEGLGGLGATFVIPMAYYSPPAPSEPIYDTAADQEVDRLAAEVDAQLREAELRQAEWRRAADWEDRRAIPMARYAREPMDPRPYDEAAAPEPPHVRAGGFGYYVIEPAPQPPLRYARARYADPPPPDEFDTKEPPPPPRW